MLDATTKAVAYAEARTREDLEHDEFLRLALTNSSRSSVRRPSRSASEIPAEVHLANVVTSGYTVVMAVLSIRFKRQGAYERLKRHATQRAESISGVGERLIDEGLRMAAHPGILFRDGPTGRRGGVVGGPDVWEVVALLRDLRGGVERRVARAAEQLGLTLAQVRAASRYYAEFPDEIDAEIAANADAADRELATWEAERRLLSG